MGSTSTLRGLLLVAASAVLFAAKAVLVKLAFRYGVDALTLLTLRMGISLPIFAALWAREEARARRRGAAPLGARDRAAMLGLGFVGYYLASLLDFAGLTYITASLERLVLYVYPTLVVLISALVFGRKPTRREGVALLLSYLGIALALGAQHLRLGSGALKGTALVALSALTYALYLVGSGRMIARIGATRFTAAALTAAGLAVLMHFALARPADVLALPAPVYVDALALAVLATVVPTLLLGQGIQQIGASKAAIVGTIGPVSTIAMAWVFLGERLTVLEVAGTALVLAGVLQLGRDREPRSEAAGAAPVARLAPAARTTRG